MIVTSIFFFPTVVVASPDVSPHTPITGLPYSVKDGIAILNATGCLLEYIHGDQIRTQQAIARLLLQSKKCIFAERKNDKFTSLAQRVWNQLHKQYLYFYKIENKKIRPRWNHTHFTKPIVKVTSLSFSNDQRVIPSSVINAFVSPFIAYREGIDLRPGGNFFLSARGALSLGTWFDLDLEPLAILNSAYPTANLHSGTVKLTWKNFEVKAGRSAVYWGQGDRGRMLFSGNAEPLEMIQIGSPYPFRLPWLFKHLGPSQYRIFLAVLDKKQFFNYSFLLGARYTIKPHPTIELGLGRGIMFGGDGAPSIFPLDPILELFGIRREGFIFHIPVTSDARTTSGGTNNLFTVDFRWRWPWARNTEFFFELFSEDAFWDFKQDSAINVGLWIPRLSSGGKWQALLEMTWTGQVAYTHGIFRSGYTENRRIIGTDLGPEGLELHLLQNFLITPKTKLWNDLIYQNRRQGPFLDLIPTGSAASENRGIVIIGATHLLNEHLRMTLSGAIQYIQNFNYTPSDNKTLGFGELSVEYLF